VIIVAKVSVVRHMHMTRVVDLSTGKGFHTEDTEITEITERRRQDT
jgi:hypothetical protein